MTYQVRREKKKKAHISASCTHTHKCTQDSVPCQLWGIILTDCDVKTSLFPKLESVSVDWEIEPSYATVAFNEWNRALLCHSCIQWKFVEWKRNEWINKITERASQEINAVYLINI